MVPVTTLWLPILLSAVFVFVASSLIHMVIGYHKHDYPPMAREAELLDAVRPLGIPPGDYMMPCPRNREEMRSPEFDEKVKRGPVLLLTVFPPGGFSMGKSLALWFGYSVVVGVVSACITGTALGPGAPYRSVFHLTALAAFAGYALALWQMSIWYRRKWGTTIRATIDGIIFALLTAGTFGWLWPK